jgi:hypothetical protein
VLINTYTGIVALGNNPYITDQLSIYSICTHATPALGHAITQNITNPPPSGGSVLSQEAVNLHTIHGGGVFSNIGSFIRKLFRGLLHVGKNATAYAPLVSQGANSISDLYNMARSKRASTTDSDHDTGGRFGKISRFH